ncbi:MAG TPA: hypothetical protein VNO70_08790, partial [Blastocatellia bacterium]|nr:hypothetical protein [Blastocatellia bacterium]
LTPATGSTTRVIDLASAATPPNAIIFGAAGDALGSALGIGNPNAGTDDDLIVGAPGADRPALTGGPAALADTGATYIFFGGANLNPGAGGGTTKVFDITSTSAGLRPGISIYGADTGDQMGATVASDDVTGDGTDDLVIGAPGGDGRTGAVRADSGEAYVIPGRPDLNPPSGASELRIDVSGGGGGFIRPTIFGAAAGDRAGSTVAIGRFNIDDNQDQIPDLFVSSPFANSSEGFVSMFFGGTMLTAFAELDLVSSGQDNVRFLGQAAGDELGWALATADLNNDRGSDIILGAPFADNSARTNNGEVYIVLAEAEDIPPPPNQPPTVRVLTPNGGGTVQGGANFTITWEADDPNGDETIAGFDIFLSLNGGTSFNTIIATGVSGAARSFVWAVPTGLNTTTARVRVRVTDDRGATAQDDSDSNFAITDVGVTVTLTSPNGGESFKFGQMVQIQWTVPVAQEAQVEGFDLFYSTDGGVTFPGIIAFDPLNPALSAGVRTFDWTVPNVCISQGRVLVVATSLTGAQS